MGKTGKLGRRGKSRHIYLEPDLCVVLDAIATAKGQRRIDIEPHRSQMISKAVQNFIDDCRNEDEALRAAISRAEAELHAQKIRNASGKKSTHGLEVLSPKM